MQSKAAEQTLEPVWFVGSVWRELRQYFLRYHLAIVPAGCHL